MLKTPKPPGIPTKYNGMRTNTAILGRAIPVLFGERRISGNLIWYGDFVAKKAKQADKKGASGLGKDPSLSYVYSSSVMVGLCQGNCAGMESVWHEGGRFLTKSVSENFTIPNGGGSYKVANYVNYSGDSGVGYPEPYSVVVNDYGSPGPATISGTQTIPFLRVQGSPASGEYGVDIGTGTYTFAAADAGKEIIVTYTFFSFKTISDELSIVPFASPYTVTIEHQPYFKTDRGVQYYPSGTALTYSLGAPSAGTYDPNGGNYKFNSADAGKGITIYYEWDDVNTDLNAPNTLNLTFISGALGQQPWSYMTSKHPNEALGYSELCYVASSGLYLGYAAVLPNYSYEIRGLYPAGAGIVDANPADCIEAMLTDPSFGVGIPTSSIDASLQGISRAYWAANNFFISEYIESSSASAASTIGKWLEASQVACFWSEGLLKFVPYGDTTAVGNGYTFTPPTNPVVSLTDSDFVAKKDPVKMNRRAWQDAYNKVGVRWSVRTNSYNDDVLYAQDDAAIMTYGLRIEPPLDYSFLCTEAAAQFAANMRVQRNVAIRNTYEFTVKSNYSYLEPMDIIEITDPNLGLSATPVRILSIDDDPKAGLSIKAEDFPWSISSVVLYPKQDQQPSYSMEAGEQDPGKTDLFVIEAPSAMGLQAGNLMYIFVNGKNTSWGGCNLWMSYNGTDYNYLTTVAAGGRFGTLATELPVGTDPDTADTLTVNMENSAAALLSVTKDDADRLVTLSALSTPAINVKTQFQNLAGAGANMATPHAPVAGNWNNPANLTSTTNYADVGVTGGGAGSSVASGWAEAYDFGFSFPGQYVLGFQIDFEAATGWISDGGAAGVAVQLVDGNGNLIGTAKLVTIPGPPVPSYNFQNYTVGGALPEANEWGSSLAQEIGWGASLSASAVESVSFGVAFQAVMTNTGYAADIKVRNVRITVFTYPAVSVELISYEDASLSGLNQYQLTYLRRGQLGTAVQDWPAGTIFARLDDASYEFQYPSSFIGRTVYLKATSFNLLGNQQQSLADVSPLIVPLQGIPGAFDLLSGSVNTGAGATPPSYSGSLTYVSGTNYITWNWNITVWRNDGTKQVFIGSQEVYNLSSATTYYFYPYLDDTNGTSKAYVTMVAGVNGVGTPSWAQTVQSADAAQIQSSLGHMPLSGGAMPAATTSSGTSGGSGGGGGTGGGGCFSGNTVIRTCCGTQMFCELTVGEEILVPNRRGSFRAEVMAHDYDGPMLDMGGGELVTLDHPFSLASGWSEAREVFAGAPLVNFKGKVYNLHVKSDDPAAHHYILGNGKVAHNKMKL